MSKIIKDKTTVAVNEHPGRSVPYQRKPELDGECVCIRECLYLGVPVVASDAVCRPPGCILFRNRDMQSLNQIVEKVLRDSPRYRQETSNYDGQDYGQRVIDVYKQVLSTDVRNSVKGR